MTPRSFSLHVTFNPLRLLSVRFVPVVPYVDFNVALSLYFVLIFIQSPCGCVPVVTCRVVCIVHGSDSVVTFCGIA